MLRSNNFQRQPLIAFIMVALIPTLLLGTVGAVAVLGLSSLACHSARTGTCGSSQEMVVRVTENNPDSGRLVLTVQAPAVERKQQAWAVAGVDMLLINEATIRRYEGLLQTGGSIGVCLLILLVFFLASRKSEIVVQALNTMSTSVERSRDEAMGPAEIVVEERSRMAQELHDTIVQGLIAVIVQLRTVEGILGEDAPPDALRRIAIARHVAQDSLIEARRSVLNLLPTPLAEGGLNYALASLKLGLEADGIAYTMELEPGDDLPEAVEKELFRTAQEALANVRKHSGARHVLVKLRREGERVVLIVADDGHGFDPTALSGPYLAGGFGLWSIRSRLASIGGSVSIESSPGAGTTVTAEVPGRL